MLFRSCSHEAAYEEVGSQAISYTTGVPTMIGAKMVLLWYGKDTKDYIRTTDKNKSQDPKEYTKIKLIGPLKNWDEALSLDDTLKASTINGAKTINLDKEIGSIEVGKKADVMILNMNIRKVSIDEIENVKPVKTFFGGKQIGRAHV